MGPSPPSLLEVGPNYGNVRSTWIATSSCALFLMLVVSTTAAQLAATSHPRIVRSSQGNEAKPVARINGTVLTEFDLQREMVSDVPLCPAAWRKSAENHGARSSAAGRFR